MLGTCETGTSAVGVKTWIEGIESVKPHYPTAPQAGRAAPAVLEGPLGGF